MSEDRRDEVLFRPIERPGRGILGVALLLVGVLAWSLFMYWRQWSLGLGVTGMAQPVTWAFYIISFVFFIGISHAGTLISAILRLSHAEWRRPITRMAEVITVIVLVIGGLHPVIDLGRPDRLLNVFSAGRLQSPLLWDVVSITAYFTASTVYLYLPLIPDIAILRDRGTRPRWFYEFLAWGWRDTPRQRRVLERAMNILMVMVIPIAVSVHTVISYIFAMTLQPGWHSTIFGPYFVVGAIFSGIAALLMVMLVFRKVFHLEPYLKAVHFQHLSSLLLVMAVIWFYFTFCEYLTGYFGHEPNELAVFWYKFAGAYAPYFWTMIACNFAIPVLLLGCRRTRSLPGIFAASACVVIGMWLERLIIVVPSLTNPRLTYPRGLYVPSLVEWSLLAGAVAAFVLGYIAFSRLFPLISVWEVREGEQHSVAEVAARVESYLPDRREPAAPAAVEAT